jgi:glucokinase
MSSYLAGVDIGGTKCAVSVGRADGDGPEVIGKRRFATPPGPNQAMAQIIAELTGLCDELGVRPAAAGVSCGGPLDSRRGRVLAPPNLPGWDDVDVLSPLRAALGAPAALQNDANACALAEWRWGAGRGSASMIFLTFGTGMGAGLILDGRLYAGASDMAGEVGHIRLAEWGPVGYGKAGSFEGFCSGGGIAQLGRQAAEVALQQGAPPAWCPTREAMAAVSAELLGQAASQGDALALQVFDQVARRLGQGLALLIDILNPELLVIGSIYGRQQALLEPRMREVLQAECLPHALGVCRVVAAGLGEQVGDFAALAVARSLVS